ncbi:DUF309 domain-containing protein [Fodinisporobacter ferrooxydans]|uniref:DUF309 domain-containing protein n=1 Tax=Fodinisporobacter ferrooxydans TaxID=2901836 RepID=A0ABY4CK19_9BACL|nr:DUF309 domain-containing protein [Alicyclobacillaceae bacterium MYW30-H2]
MEEYAPFYIDYLYCFNTLRNFFDCHEYGEHLWLDTGRPEFLKGLIQVAVSLYHLENGNLRGSRIMWAKASGYLEPYKPVHMGIHIGTIYEDMNRLHQLLPDADRVAAEDVQTWNLPDIYIQIVDDSLQGILEHWTLSPLEDE